jgi:hypothetical protein
MVKYLGPYQTVCDDWNYWWTYIADHFSEATSFGYAQRALLMQNNSTQPNSLSNQGANAPMNGGTVDSPQGGNGFAHGQVYGAAIDGQGNADCETGQRGYLKQENHLDPQNRQFASDPHNPGSQGTTWNGRAKVPTGETFSRGAETGPNLPNIPQNP